MVFLLDGVVEDLVETAPSSYLIDHDASAHDDRVISLALAAYKLVTTTAKRRPDSKRLAAAMAQASAELYKPGVAELYP